MNKEIIASLPLQKQNLAVSLCQGKWWPAGLRGKVRMWELDHKEVCASKNWCFQIVVLDKTLRVPWTARRSNQSILKEINLEYSLEALMLKLKLQYFGHLMWRADSLEKILMLGKTEGRRISGQQRMRCLDGIIDSTNMSLSKLQEILKVREAWHAAVHGVTRVEHNWMTEQQNFPLITQCL